MRKVLILALALFPVFALGQTRSTAVISAGSLSAQPAVCAAGREFFVQTDTTPWKVWVCNATSNGWGLAGGSGSATPGGDDLSIQFRHGATLDGFGSYDPVTGIISFGTPSPFEASIDASGITAARTLLVPDASGTIALQEWVNGLGLATETWVTSQLGMDLAGYATEGWVTAGFLPISTVLPANTTATTHQFFTAYNSGTGAFTKAQPIIGDVDGLQTALDGKQATGSYLTSVACSNLPALTGAVTSSAGSCTTILAAQPVDVGVTYNGKPAGGVTLVRHPFPFAVTIPAGCTNSRIISEAAVTADSTFTLYKNGVSFGTAVIAAGQTSATFTCASSASFAAGDILKLTSPAVADATLADLGGTIYGTR